MSERPWWQTAVIYQIYPRSFQDSNGDGIGDLAGITSRIDYLKWLGVDAVWISPFYRSPMKDFGYDVADYMAVDPMFGTLDDFDAMIAAMHAAGLRLILDFVPNHTSDQHAWFQESRTSRDSAKRDWYIWHDAKADGSPPNNWLSNAGGPAWTFDAATQQYYYHGFLPEQPDLNWRNPAVRAAMHDALRFWLRRGVDGFRMDVLWHLAKDPEFRDDPVNPEFKAGDPSFRQVIQTWSSDHPDVHHYVAELRGVMREFGDALMIGEIYLPVERLVKYYGNELGGAQLPFNFQLIGASWHAETLAAMIEAYDRALPPGGWGNWVLGNHDQPRIVSRVGHAQARVAAMLLLTLRGTPTLYYGDELGMENVPIPPEAERDPFGLRMPGTGQGRDPERTPMRWDDQPGAGFSTGEPWLPIGDDAAAVNVASLRQDPGSMLHHVQAMLRLRKDHAALAIGDYRPLVATGDTLAYERRTAEEVVAVFLNLSSEPRALTMPNGFAGTVLHSTHADRVGSLLDDVVELRADEGVVVALSA